MLVAQEGVTVLVLYYNGVEPFIWNNCKMPGGRLGGPDFYYNCDVRNYYSCPNFYINRGPSERLLRSTRQYTMSPS